MKKGDRYKIIRIQYHHPSWYLGEIGEVIVPGDFFVAIKLRCKTIVTLPIDCLVEEK